MSEQNCGTCGWWKETADVGLRYDSYGDCEAPVPDSVEDRFMIRAYEGTTCPCWKERE